VWSAVSCMWATCGDRGYPPTTRRCVRAWRCSASCLDEGQAGDNIGVLLRGTKRDEVERGPGGGQARDRSRRTRSSRPSVHIEQGRGRASHPVFQRVPAAVLFPDNGCDRDVELPEGVEMVMPGTTWRSSAELITPIAMEKELRFAIREGGRTVGCRCRQRYY
jgi:elongation factor Tu